VLDGGGASEGRMLRRCVCGHALNTGHSLPVTAQLPVQSFLFSAPVPWHTPHAKYSGTAGALIGVWANIDPSHDIHPAVRRLHALGAAFCAAAVSRNGVPLPCAIDSRSMRASGTASDTRYWEPSSSFTKIAKLDEYSVPTSFAFHVC
jgi:hypothetical protein